MSSVATIAQSAGPGAAKAAARKRNRNVGGANKRPGWVTYLLLGAVILISAYPLYYVILLASSTQEIISQSPLPDLVPDGHLAENIKRVFDSDIPLMKGLVNSFIVAVVQVASVVMFSTLAGYSFAKLRFRGRGPLLVFVIATMAIPTQLGVVPLFIVMRELGWSGDLRAVILPGIVTAFGVFWMTQFLENALPYELIEAARVDGASMIRTFWHVALPAARPAAAMLALFTAIGSWTNYFWPSIILTNQNPTLPMVVRQLQASYFQDYSLIMAGVLLATLPLFIVFVIAGKQLVAGIMAGAVKG
ncbi:carbohydrate ABC transporter permease [Sanguibacter hominis ATCC BAA-789]|uniref:Carbohydrate ABC transporter permease n=1 Tax=Sanguibacter hominis ATCC BAA-789 TaxID=1312740 RepID=A0A9X5FCA3_9MICO|nr:carbohydrate ABC transporter permease [Sanguibacter hominis]NKX93690.1 carbohydrate ABC transporter permease [Sanguibacter hominis ATCC BAA-789]